MFHPVGVWWAEELIVPASNILCRVLGRGADASSLEAGANPVSDSYPVGVSASLKRCAGWGTHCAGRISVGEAHALGGEAINCGGAVIVTALTGEVHPAHVVHEDYNDVGLISSW